MAANHNVTLTQQQREILVGMAGTNFVAVDKYGNDIRVSVSEWKKGNMHRLYINFEIRSKTSGGWKNDEKVFLNINDASDLNFTFDGDANWLILEAQIAAQMPEEDTPATENIGGGADEPVEAYKASHNSGETLIIVYGFDSGIIYEKPHGGKWTQTETIADPHVWMEQATAEWQAEWMEADDVVNELSAD